MPQNSREHETERISVADLIAKHGNHRAGGESQIPSGHRRSHENAAGPSGEPAWRSVSDVTHQPGPAVHPEPARFAHPQPSATVTEQIPAVNAATQASGHPTPAGQWFSSNGFRTEPSAAPPQQPSIPTPTDQPAARTETTQQQQRASAQPTAVAELNKPSDTPNARGLDAAVKTETPADQSDPDKTRAIDETLQRFTAVHDHLAEEEARRRNRFAWLLGNRRPPELGKDMPFEYTDRRDPDTSRLEWKKQVRQRRIVMSARVLAVAGAILVLALLLFT